jgi:hypothetical protein
MEAGLSLARTSAPPAINARYEPALQTAVTTELDAARSVTATNSSSAPTAHDAALAPPPPRQDTAQNIVLDPQSREVIFREISVRSGEVIDQVPGDATLKLRAYLREIANPDPDHKLLEKTS